MSLMLDALRKAEKRARGDAMQDAAGSAASAGDAADAGRATEFALEPVHAAAMPEPAAAPAPRRASCASAANELLASADSPAPALRERYPVSFWLCGLGVLGLIGGSAGLHFWNELRPGAAVVTARPARLAGDRAVAVPPPTPEIAAIPGLAEVQAPQATQSLEPAPPARPTIVAQAAKAPVKAAAAESAAPRRPPAPGRSEARQGSRIHVQVQSGYAAFTAGEFDLARSAYEQALREEPANRDAVLGMAALEVHAGRLDSAEVRYEALLRAAPDDPDAFSGLLGLRAEKVDPLHTESRLKTLLATHPDAAMLHFTLGNQLVRQGRWAEAQQAYLRAHAHDRGNPDFAFNLAVSLDRLRRPDEATEHYARALQLAERRAASFSPAAVRQRLQQLKR
jgi:tetratricopeptide (TPR) repeat protein